MQYRSKEPRQDDDGDLICNYTVVVLFDLVSGTRLQSVLECFEPCNQKPLTEVVDLRFINFVIRGHATIVRVMRRHGRLIRQVDPANITRLLNGEQHMGFKLGAFAAMNSRRQALAPTCKHTCKAWQATNALQ